MRRCRLFGCRHPRCACRPESEDSLIRRRPLSIALLLIAAVLLSLGGPVAASKRAAFPGPSLGARGIDVVALQHLLRARGYGLPTDGVFGSSTQAAVAAFQETSGLPASGAADGDTWERLVPRLSEGSSGEAVTALQKLLNAKRDAGLAVNGRFEAGTRTAVERFQKHMRLEVTGAANPTTWRNLLWHFLKPAFSQAGLCNYNGGNAGADWGTGSTVGALEAAAALFYRRSGSKIAIGDIGWEHGGNIVLHATHESGLDADIALVRHDRNQCRRPGIDYKSRQYDRAATRDLIRAVYEAGPNQVKLIYFNDPVLVREGLVQRYPLHNDHIHVRYCEVGHREARYRCAAPELDEADLALPGLSPANGARPDRW